MVRRLLAILALCTPAAIAASSCSAELPIENLCGWLRDANNCLARFATDVGEQCGAPSVQTNDPTTTATGSFLARDKLDICIKNAGGQVIFDPPLDVAAFPVTAATFKILDAFAVPCGAGSVTNYETYSITINPVDAADAGLGGPPPDGDDITGGTYSVTLPDERQVFDVTCPFGEETHHFNTYTLDKCLDQAQPYVAAGAPQGLPEAIIDSSPGIPESPATASKPGYVRLRVFYPPEAGATTPRIVEYFNCLVPPPPPPCQDTVQNGDETDVDCGGSCPTKCAQGQKCINPADCVTGSCGFNGGMKQCL